VSLIPTFIRGRSGVITGIFRTIKVQHKKTSNHLIPPKTYQGTTKNIQPNQLIPALYQLIPASKQILNS